LTSIVELLVKAEFDVHIARDEIETTVTDRARRRVSSQSRLFRNIGSVTISSAIGGAASFVFWLVAAHRFSLSRIGTSGALVVTLANVINVVTSLGFNGASIANAHTKRGNGGLLVIGTVGSAVLSVGGSGVVVAIMLVIARHSLIMRNPLELFLLLSLLSGAAAIGGVSDVVGGPLGNAWLAPVRNTVLLALRMVVVFSLGRTSSAIAIAFAFAFPMIVTSVVSTIFLIIEVRIRESRFWPDFTQRRAFWKYSLHSLPSTVVMSTIPTAAPLIAIAVIGTKLSAVFYMSWNGMVLANIVIASATVLGVAPDIDHDYLIRLVRRVAGVCSVLMTLGGPVFLLLFGGIYFRDGAVGISLLGLSLYPYGQEQLQVTMLRRAGDHHRTSRITLVLGVVTLSGLAIGGIGGSVWSMALGWLAATTGLLLIGTRLTSRQHFGNWLPALPRFTDGAR
jgi:O-antigen/teichoic acid export membrane protein